jgi:hypothetical protein
VITECGVYRILSLPYHLGMPVLHRPAVDIHYDIAVHVCICRHGGLVAFLLDCLVRTRSWLLLLP